MATVPTSPAAHGSGHNAMNDAPPALPIEPRRRETSEEHQKRMDKKRGQARYFEALDRAAAAPSTKTQVQDTRAKAIAAYRAGDGVKAVATRFRISPATLQNWLEEDHVPVRDAAQAAEVARARAAAPQTQPAPRPAAPAPRPAPPGARVRTPSPEERARLAAVTAYVAGDTAAEIAAREGLSESKVRRWLAAAGVRMRPGGSRPTPLDLDALAERYRAGATCDELAAEVGLTNASMARRLRAHGVQMRRGGAAQRHPDPAPSLPAAAPSTPAPLSTPAPAEPDEPPAAPVEIPAAASNWTVSRALLERDPAEAERVRLREALAAQRPPQIHDAPEAIAAVRESVQRLLDEVDNLRDRWTDLQLARDLDAAGAFGRIRVSAEQVLALTNQPTPERNAS